jgi:hypothetical protein
MLLERATGGLPIDNVVNVELSLALQSAAWAEAGGMRGGKTAGVGQRQRARCPAVRMERAQSKRKAFRGMKGGQQQKRLIER